MAKKKGRVRSNKRSIIPKRMDELNEQLKQRGEQFAQGKHNKFSKLDMRQLYQLAFMGMSDIELCQHFRVAIDTFRAWQNPDDKSYRPEIVEALFRGRDGAVSSVAHALERRARGYRQKQQVLIVGKGGKIETHTVIKQLPPDYASAAFILKNKRPKDWQDKQTIEGGAAVTVQPVINIVTDPESIKKLTKLKDEATKGKTK